MPYSLPRAPGIFSFYAVLRFARGARAFWLPAALAALSACQTGIYSAGIPAPDYPEEISDFQGIEVTHQLITWELITKLPAQDSQEPEAPPDWGEIFDAYRYRLGPGDELTLAVWEHPEYSFGVATGQVIPQQVANRQALAIAKDGNVYLPLLAPIKLSGLTLEEARTVLASRLAAVIEAPLIHIRLLSFKSQYAFVIDSDGTYQEISISDRPLTLPAAVAARLGRSPSNYPRRVTLTRNRETRTIDLRGILMAGRLSSELLLRHGDIIRIPAYLENSVRLFGEWRGNRAIGVPPGGLRLGRVLLEGGLSFEADYSTIHVIRALFSSAEAADSRREPPAKIEIYTLDVRDFDAQLIAESFPMRPGDYVLAPTAPITRWNRLIRSILPSYGLVGGTDRLIQDLQRIEARLE